MYIEFIKLWNSKKYVRLFNLGFKKVKLTLKKPNFLQLQTTKVRFKLLVKLISFDNMNCTKDGLNLVFLFHSLMGTTVSSDKVIILQSVRKRKF